MRAVNLLKRSIFITSLFFSLHSLAANITDSDITAIIKKQISTNLITASTHDVKLISDSGRVNFSGMVTTDQQPVP